MFISSPRLLTSLLSAVAPAMAGTPFIQPGGSPPTTEETAAFLRSPDAPSLIAAAYSSDGNEHAAGAMGRFYSQLPAPPQPTAELWRSRLARDGDDAAEFLAPLSMLADIIESPPDEASGEGFALGLLAYLENFEPSGFAGVRPGEQLAIDAFWLSVQTHLGSGRIDGVLRESAIACIRKWVVLYGFEPSQFARTTADDWMNLATRLSQKIEDLGAIGILPSAIPRVAHRYSVGDVAAAKDILRSGALETEWPAPLLVGPSWNGPKFEEIAEVLREIEIFPERLVTDANEPQMELRALAISRAKRAAEENGRPAIADASELMVDALQGAPAFPSKKWDNDQIGWDEETRNAAILSALEGAPGASRVARLRTVLAYCEPGSEPVAIIRDTEGSITLAPAGENGFGYDKIFRPRYAGCTFAEMEPQEKARYDQRGAALIELMQRLNLMRRRTDVGARIRNFTGLIDYDPAALLKDICEKDAAFRRRFERGGNTTGETLYDHTLAVMKRFEALLNSIPGIREKIAGFIATARFAPLFHDGGKSAAIASGTPRLQKEFTNFFSRATLERWGMTDSEKALIFGMINADPSDGAYGFRPPNLDAVWKKFLARAPEGIPLDIFFNLAILLFIADASYYPNVMSATFVAGKDGSIRIHPDDPLIPMLRRMEMEAPQFSAAPFIAGKDDLETPQGFLRDTVRRKRHEDRLHENPWRRTMAYAAGFERATISEYIALFNEKGIERRIGVDLSGAGEGEIDGAVQRLNARIQSDDGRTVLVGIADTPSGLEILRRIHREKNIPVMLMGPVNLLAPDREFRVPAFDIYRFENNSDGGKLREEFQAVVTETISK